jgi:endonuclease III
MMAEDDYGEWERPIGLTAEYAISLCDSTDDDCDDVDERGGCAAAASSGDDIRSSGQSNVVVADEEGGASSSSSSSSSPSSSMRNDDGRSTDDRAMRLGGEKEIDDAPFAVVSPNEERPSSPAGGGGHDAAIDDDNPFASFAFRSEEASTSTWRRTTSTTLMPTESITRPVAKRGGAAIVARRRNAAAMDEDGNGRKKRRMGGGTHPLFSRGTGGTHYDDVNGNDDGTATYRGEKKGERIEERRKLVERWHAYADPIAPIEQRRFQILLAARLHARCQSPIVLAAMCKLRKYFDEKGNESGGGGLTALSLSNADPETDIAPLLSSVLFGNEKARQIVRAARDVISKFGGRVPETMIGLREITGIGPKLAEILMIVNRRCTFLSEATA